MEIASEQVDVNPIADPTQRVFSPEEIEDADFHAVANPSNTLVLPDNCNRGGAVSFMAKTIPMNEFGLPLYYVRSDLLDLALICHRGYITQEEVDDAGELLHYEDGYPTFQNGSPFWTQMPHEPHPNYLLFKAYLSLDESEGIRLLDSLANNQNLPIEAVREYAQEFFWSSRARAYDLFVVAAEAKKREVRIRKTEDSHFKTAATMLESIINRFNDNPDLIQDMDAKQLLDAFEQMVKIQRLSLGLTGQHASSVDPSLKTPGASTEVILRQLTKNVGLSEQGAEGFQNRLALLMSDEATALQAQELVIRVTGAGAGQ